MDEVRNKIVAGNITPYEFPHRDELLPFIPHNSEHGLDKVRDGRVFGPRGRAVATDVSGLPRFWPAGRQDGDMIAYQLTGLIDPAGVLSVPVEHFREWFRYETECVVLWSSSCVGPHAPPSTARCVVALTYLAATQAQSSAARAAVA